MSLQIRFAQVVRVYPKYRACEIAFLDDGWRVTNVPILGDYASSDTGRWSMHNMPRPPSEEEAGGYQPNPDERTVLAVVAMVDDRPMILGFLPHAMTQLAFIQEEQNRDMDRHPSGTNSTTNRNGSWTLQHTGGAFIRVAAQVDSDVEPDRYEDLTAKCWNENWRLPENEPCTITITTGNRDGEAMKLRFRPNGDVDQMSSGYLHIEHAKDLHVDIGESAQVHVTDFSTHTAGGDVKIRTPASVTVTAGGDAHLLALGRGNACSAGPMLVGSLEKLTLEAPIIDIITGELNVQAGAVGFTAGDFAVDAAVASVAAGAIGLTAVETSVMGVLGVTGVAVAEEFVTGVVPPVPPLPAGMPSGAGGVAEEIALAEAERAAAEEDLAEAAENIALAVEEAVETSSAAVGLGPMDNLGGVRPGDSSAGDTDDVVE